MLIEPALPPANKLPIKNLPGFALASIPVTNFLFKASLIEKLMA